MDNMHLYEVSGVMVKSIHQEWNIMQVVKLPALADERITKDILECDSITIQLFRQVPDPCQLPRRSKVLSIPTLALPRGTDWSRK
jgi:hypothetical protein